MLNHKDPQQNHTSENNINLDPGLDVEVKKAKAVKTPDFVHINVKLLSVCLVVVLAILLINTSLFAYKYYQCKATSDSSPTRNLIAELFKVEEKTTKAKFNGRLPTGVKPLAYKIKILPFLIENNFTFLGEVWIHVEVSQTTNNITLHMNDLTILERSIKQVDNRSANWESDEGTSLTIGQVRNDTINQFMVFELEDEQFWATKRYVLYIKYVGKLNDQMRGLYRSSYEVNNTKRWIMASQFQATDARRAFPCFDEPSLKAKFAISIGRLPNMTAISNMPLKDGNQSDPLGFLCMVDWENLENFGLITFRENSMLYDEQISTNYHKERIATIVAHELAHQWFGNLVTLAWWNDLWLNEGFASYIEYFGVDSVEHTWKIKDIFVVDELQNVFFLDALKSSHPVHVEVSHPDEITEIFDKISYSKGSSLLRMAEHFLTTEVLKLGLQKYIKKKAMGSSTQAELWAFLTNAGHEMRTLPEKMDVETIMNTWTLQTGFPRMAEHFLTTEVLKLGLQKYIKKKAMGSSTQAELWAFLTNAGHEMRTLPENMDVETIMNTWTLQTGFPVIRVARDYDAGSAVVKQVRVFPTTSENPPPKYTRYSHNDPSSEGRILLNEVPLAVDETTKMLNHKDPQQNHTSENNINLDPGLDVEGYYRVLYDEKNWYLIIATLRNSTTYNTIHLLNRAQLIDDAMNLARAGLLDYKIALDVTAYLQYETELVPWRSAMQALGYIEGQLYRRAYFDKYKKYLLHIIRPMYESIGFDGSPKDDQMTVYKRVDVLNRACILGLKDCVQKALSKYQNWISNPSKIENIPVNLKSIILCTGIRWGLSQDWDQLWTKYTQVTIASEKDIYLSALACSSEYWILSRYLEYALTESLIRKQDAPRVFSLVSQSAVGHTVALDFLYNNWDRIKKHFNGTQFQVTSIVKFCTKRISNELELTQLKNFVETNYKDLLASSRTIMQIIENAETNVKWMRKNYEPIVQWLNDTSNYDFTVIS
ncbi:LOW QUALITY PROTEIN: aminopeptidase N-like [Diaphorina citri]|uniref:Aminopeptidase n=1 Tax=Diaphorina citri TaxID=121845 RepID=A0A3Q0J6M2_DIACI|nr:LOW QUALITY PROTEIN: aminopeptidase N-like [Diaphorina citri]